jgi:hypothetical protein
VEQPSGLFGWASIPTVARAQAVHHFVNTTSYDYDALNRLKTVSAPGGTVSLSYVGLAGNLQAMAYPGNYARYQYDDKSPGWLFGAAHFGFPRQLAPGVRVRVGPHPCRPRPGFPLRRHPRHRL